MSHKEHEVSGIIDVEDERRLYKCARKYEMIVKQFDELGAMMKDGTIVPKWRRVPSSQRGSASGASAVASSSQPDNNEALVQTVTRFLHELRAKPTDSECSNST